MPQNFIHLHSHSEYSMIDGLLRIEEWVKKSKALGYTSLALTDQNNLFAMVKFYQAAEKAGIKPIIGAEVLIDPEKESMPPNRMILLCQNEIGYRNLTFLISKAYTEGQVHSVPLISKKWFSEKTAGLIAIACQKESDIGRSLLLDNVEEIHAHLNFWNHLFPDRFYLEIVRTGRVDEEIYVQKAVTLSEKERIPLVATNDVRFLDRPDFDAHEARVAIHQGYTLNDSARPKIYSEEQYLKRPEDMQTLFKDIPESLENSVEIAKRCNLKLNLDQVFLPNYPTPQGKNVEEYLSECAIQKLEAFYAPNLPPENYQERLKTELSVINSMGFAGYFLIVADFIQWAKDNGVPVGPGRGSGAGSLVAFVLGITGIDPIPYDLLFERFLNPERVSLPDFDIDFCMEGRDRVIDYVAERYGRSSVSQIITFGTMAAKAVIRDVGRVLGHPYGFVDKIAKLIPLELGITLEKALEQEEILKTRYKEEEEVKTLIDLAKKLEGIVRNAGKHAGGVVIAPTALTDFTPLYCDSDGNFLTQFDKNDVEKIGLVKFDFLGLRTLTIIDRTVQTVNKRKASLQEPLLNIEQIPLDDPKAFGLLKEIQTTGVFQIESRGMKDLVRRLGPDVFEEIIALVALYRPGPLQSGMVDDFINRKHGREQPEYLHPTLLSILKPTYGIILYQEQVMQIAQELAGYTLGGADLLRRAMGKKKPEEMAEQRATFVEGSVARGVSKEQASYIFDLMEKFAGYGFNKSHSAGYALITYQTAWLKAYFPAEFLAASLSSDLAHTDKVVVFIEDCKSWGIPLLPPNVNQSEYAFTVTPQGNILYGLGAIKGVGEAAIRNIIEARTQSPFIDLYDFCARVDTRKVSRRVLEALMSSGAMDSFGWHRAELLGHLEDALLAAEQVNKNKQIKQVDLFGESMSFDEIALTRPKKAIPTWSTEKRLRAEKETLGFYLSGHPLKPFLKDIQALSTASFKVLKPEKRTKQRLAGMIVGVRVVTTRKGERMAIVTLDDTTATQDVLVFKDLYQTHHGLLVEDQLILVEGEVGVDDFSGGLRVRCLQIWDFQEVRRSRAESVAIRLRGGEYPEDFEQRLMEILRPFRGAGSAGSGCTVKILYALGEGAGSESGSESGSGLGSGSHAQATVVLPEGWRVKPDMALMENLGSLCGEENVELVFKR